MKPQCVLMCVREKAVEIRVTNDNKEVALCEEALNDLDCVCWAFHSNPLIPVGFPPGQSTMRQAKPAPRPGRCGGWNHSESGGLSLRCPSFLVMLCIIREICYI